MPKKAKKPERPHLYPVLPLSGHHIRILKMLPKDEDEILKCITDVVDLNDSPIYRGLSYVCGTMDNARMIELNSRLFKIRKNLWEFLHYLREQGEVDYFWCDQICIDENHLVERNRQVQIMSTIYAQATEVLACIEVLSQSLPVNPSESDSLQLLVACVKILVRELPAINPMGNSMEVLLRRFRHEFEHFQAFRSNEKMLLGTLSSTRHGPLSVLTRYVCPISKFEYWNRTWVVQEVLSARKLTLIWQQGRAPASTLQELLPLLSSLLIKLDAPTLSPELTHRGTLVDKLRQILSPGNPMLRILAQSNTQVQKSPLLGLIKFFQHSQCSDPRDKIFALLSISTEYADGRRLNVGYSKPAGQVLFETLVFLQPEPIRMLEVAKLLAEVLKLDFESLWRQTAVTRGSSKSDLAENVSFRCSLPLIGRWQQLQRIEHPEFIKCKALEYRISPFWGGDIKSRQERVVLAAGSYVFDLGDGVSLLAREPAGHTKSTPVLTGVEMWPTKDITIASHAESERMALCDLSTEQVIVALQLEANLFRGTPTPFAAPAMWLTFVADSLDWPGGEYMIFSNMQGNGDHEILGACAANAATFSIAHLTTQLYERRVAVPRLSSTLP